MTVNKENQEDNKRDRRHGDRDSSTVRVQGTGSENQVEAERP